jgi:hypothetical protein
MAGLPARIPLPFGTVDVIVSDVPDYFASRR